jgi:hypothetical protein
LNHKIYEIEHWYELDNGVFRINTKTVKIRCGWIGSTEVAGSYKTNFLLFTLFSIVIFPPTYASPLTFRVVISAVANVVVKRIFAPSKTSNFIILTESLKDAFINRHYIIKATTPLTQISRYTDTTRYVKAPVK